MRVFTTVLIASQLIALELLATSAEADQTVCPDKSEPCMNDTNFAECQKLVADGCTNLLTAESCPLQFSCDTSTDPEDPFGLCPPVGDCVLQKQHDECIALVNDGCTEIVSDMMCPVGSFGCIKKDFVCPPIDGRCVLQEQYDECMQLVSDGCTDIAVAESCPVQFGCNPSPEACPPIDGTCILEEQYEECKALEDSGCTQIFMQKSCPVQFECSALPVPSPGTETSICAPIDGGCIREKQYNECKKLEDAGCRNIYIIKTCPPSYRCDDLRFWFGNLVRFLISLIRGS